MAMAQDRNADLLKRKREQPSRTYKATRLCLIYARKKEEMNKAGADSIDSFRKTWMYYDYSPQWIAELAQAKYALLILH